MSRKPTRQCKRTDCPQCTKTVDKHVVSALTRQENLTPNSDGNNTENLATVDSNWLEQWTPQMMQQLQTDDETITTAICLPEQYSAKPVIHSPNQELVTLLRQWDQLRLRDGLLFREFVTNDSTVILQLIAPKSLRFEIMNQLHNNRISGHLGREKTLSKIRSRFYWPGMTSHISRWCQTCGSCARAKPGPGKGKYPMSHCTVYGPLECIAIDIMGRLPETDNGN